MLVHARAAVQAAGDALLAAQEDTQLRGVLRVASFRSTATHLLPPALAAFRAQHPGVTVRLLDGETGSGGQELVRRGQADAAIVIEENWGDLRLTPLVMDEYLFVAPARRGSHPVTPDDLGTTAAGPGAEFLQPARDGIPAPLRRAAGTRDRDRRGQRDPGHGRARAGRQRDAPPGAGAAARGLVALPCPSG